MFLLQLYRSFKVVFSIQGVNICKQPQDFDTFEIPGEDESGTPKTVAGWLNRNKRQCYSRSPTNPSSVQLLKSVNFTDHR